MSDQLDRIEDGIQKVGALPQSSCRLLVADTALGREVQGRLLLFASGDFGLTVIGLGSPFRDKANKAVDRIAFYGVS